MAACEFALLTFVRVRGVCVCVYGIAYARQLLIAVNFIHVWQAMTYLTNVWCVREFCECLRRVIQKNDVIKLH